MKSISSLKAELNNLRALEVGRSRAAPDVHLFFFSFVFLSHWIKIQYRIHSYELKLNEIAKLFWLQSPWGFCPRVKRLLENS